MKSLVFQSEGTDSQYVSNLEGNQLQYSCQENLHGQRSRLQSIGVAKSQTQLIE